MPDPHDIDPASIALAAFIIETFPRLTLEDVLTKATRRGLRELARDALVEHERADDATATRDEG